MNGANDIEKITLCFDYNNLQSICDSCHKKEHGGDDITGQMMKFI